ncbi:MAG: hypothetical protein IKF90_14240 [Parasporobacterium sp.]|nr:hypothetical protein [Parasporobacterium sp.]
MTLTTYNEYNIAIAKAQSAYQGLTGEINIGILDGTRISDLFPGVLSYFHEKHPNVEIKMQYYSFRRAKKAEKEAAAAAK